MATTDPAAGSLGDRVRSLRLPVELKRGASVAWGKWLIALVLIATASGAAWYYLPGAAADAGTASDATPVAKAQPVTAERPIAPAIASTANVGDVVLEWKGHVVPAHQILVSPKVSGMIISLNFEEGMRVKKGDVLAELESVDYRADVARCSAMLASAKDRHDELVTGNRPEEIAASEAELAEAVAQRDQLYSEWQRNIGLRGNKTVSQREYEQSESQYRAMDRRVARLSNNFKVMKDGPRKERIRVAEAEVNQAEADLAKAQWRLSNCTVLAPISGIILKKNAEEGNIVNSMVQHGSYSLCELADLADLEIDLSIQERDIAKVHRGQRCAVRIEPAYPDRVYEGVVSRLMPIGDRSKGAVPVRVKVTVPADEEGVYLKPEMSTVVSFYKD